MHSKEKDVIMNLIGFDSVAALLYGNGRIQKYILSLRLLELRNGGFAHIRAWLPIHYAHLIYIDGLLWWPYWIMRML